MKNVVRNSIALICCSALLFLASCEKENLDETETVVTDPQGNGGDDVFCDELENGNPNYTSGFVGAECWTAADEEGTISEDCECVASESSDFDCPELEANFQDDCSTQEIAEGFVNENCECQEWASQYDCPELFANVGDECYAAVGVIGAVTEDCECVAEDESFCEDLQNGGPNYPSGFIGAECYTAADEQGTISGDCECVANDPVLTDCPDFYESGVGANFGDSCETYDQETDSWLTGIIDENCNCETLDCPGLNGNIGDPCQGGWGIITEDCGCVENPD